LPGRFSIIAWGYFICCLGLFHSLPRFFNHHLHINSLSTTNNGDLYRSRHSHSRNMTNRETSKLKCKL
jgi:hypothetical protein